MSEQLNKVCVNVAQNFNSAEKAQARANIGAAAEGSVGPSYTAGAGISITGTTISANLVTNGADLAADTYNGATRITHSYPCAVKAGGVGGYDYELTAEDIANGYGEYRFTAADELPFPYGRWVIFAEMLQFRIKRSGSSSYDWVGNEISSIDIMYYYPATGYYGSLFTVSAANIANDRWKDWTLCANDASPSTKQIAIRWNLASGNTLAAGDILYSHRSYVSASGTWTPGAI
jgi:hypothetical protein